MRFALIAVALTLLAGCAAAPSDPSPALVTTPEKVESIEAFFAHQDYIRAGLLDGSLGEISERDIESVIAHQDELRALLGDLDSVDQLSEENKIRVMNAQNAINGILTRSFADTPICRRETVLGSHRQRTVCLTARQREKLREDSRESLRYLRNSMLPLKN